MLPKGRGLSALKIFKAHLLAPSIFRKYCKFSAFVCRVIHNINRSPLDGASSPRSIKALVCGRMASCKVTMGAQISRNIMPAGGSNTVARVWRAIDAAPPARAAAMFPRLSSAWEARDYSSAPEPL